MDEAHRPVRLSLHATPWPKVANWPAELGEHITYLSTNFRGALNCIEQAKDHSVSASLVNSLTLCVLSYMTKTRSVQNMQTIANI